MYCLSNLISISVVKSIFVPVNSLLCQLFRHRISSCVKLLDAGNIMANKLRRLWNKLKETFHLFRCHRCIINITCSSSITLACSFLCCKYYLLLIIGVRGQESIIHHAIGAASSIIIFILGRVKVETFTKSDSSETLIIKIVLRYLNIMWM